MMPARVLTTSHKRRRTRRRTPRQRRRADDRRGTEHTDRVLVPPRRRVSNGAQSSAEVLGMGLPAAVTGIAHEVRHPVLALRAAAHLLTTELAGNATAGAARVILDSETARLDRLADDLLELGRSRRLDLVPCHPPDLVEQALAGVADQWESTLELCTDIDAETPAVLADPPAMVRVLSILLANAYRHALGARRITVSADHDRAHALVQLRVADDGIGIPVVDQTAIFEPFFSSTGGAGIGLAVASRLVSKHGGRLTVDSTPGVGTVFTITLRSASPGSSRDL